MGSHLDDVLLAELREVMEDGFDELLSVFLRESAENNRQMLEQWASGDRSGLRRLAHALKGSCSNMGAMHCAELASALENAAHHGNWDNVPELLGQFDMELAQTHAALGALSGPG